MMWLGVACSLLIVAFFARIGAAILSAYEQAAESFQPVPDMSGGIAAIITAIAAAIPALLGAAQIFQHRQGEILDRQARGLPRDGGPPFPSSPPPDTEGPRPWQNRE